MIKFDNNVFYLHTEKSTYAMGIFEEKLLLHLYWGKRMGETLSSDMFFDIGARIQYGVDFGRYSTCLLPLEFSSYGNSDWRVPTFNCKHSDGTIISKFLYKGYFIQKGKPSIKGLPSTYSQDDDAETLVINLCDELKNIDVFLYYSVFEELNAITRSVKIVNNGEKISINSALSMSVDFIYANNMDILHLDGAWGRERNITRNPITYGNQNIESRCGASSSMHNPFIAFCDRKADEESGNVYGFSLVYSGNYTAGVEMNTYNSARVYMGINPFGFEWILENGESFNTPEAVLVYSGEGFGGMSRIYHKLYRTRLCRGKYRDCERFIVINSWESAGFDVNEKIITDLAENAKGTGIDTVVLDDGWFGKRVDDSAGLGDWVVNKERFPSGLDNLAKKINVMGMHFGLWFEPEMVNPGSELYKIHPEWILHVNGRTPSLSRNQYVLDISRKDVCEYIVESVCKVLESANIEYVKWDFNRYLTEAGSDLLSSEHQCEIMHRYVLGLYWIMERITEKFPNVLFESCASGGGRFDAGMLYYMPQIWTSDNSDAVDRLFIQYGTSIIYPYSSMAAHVSASPNLQIGRTTSIEKRCNVALSGQLGFELDLSRCDKKEIEISKKKITDYKKYGPVFHNGDCYRLASPFENDYSAIEFISEDKKTVILCFDTVKATVNNANIYIKLKNLGNESYFDGTKVYSGEYLENIGIRFSNDIEYSSKMIVFEKV